MRRLASGLGGYWFAEAPAARLALLRLVIGVYTLYYLGRRYGMLVKIARTDAALFRPVGVVAGLRRPVPVWVFRGILVATLAANLAFVLGLWHRRTGPLFAGLLLWVMCYRNSWSMIYHNDNLLMLHVVILGLTRSADAFSVDTVLGSSDVRHGSAIPAREWSAQHGAYSGPDPEGDWRYGWPIRLMNAVTTLTYLLAGVAKVKGPLGWRWASGETLRRQIGIDGLRKELLGDGAAPLASVLYDKVRMFGAMAAGSLALELGAPAVLADKRLSKLWALGAFSMHWGIYLTMKIKFRYQMSGLVFVSFFELERIVDWIASRAGKESR